MQTPIILNSKNEPIVLNEHERHTVKWMANALFNQYGSKSFKNSIGYEAAITTLTTITKRVSEAKYYQLAPADYLPVVVGEGTWSSNLLTYRSYDVSDIFESGIVDTGGNNARLSTADAAVDSLTIKIYNWAKALAYSIFDLELAAKSGNWDLVAAKEKSRKRNWDLGVQKVAFLGAQGQNGAGGSCLGLLNQPGITFNSSLITQALSTMSYTQLAAFQAGIIKAYRVNNNFTSFPTHFHIPESDYNGLVTQSSPQFPVKSTLQLLEEGFKVICRNADFKILPLAYADVANSQGLLSKQTYVLMNYDEESVKMEIPLPYNTTLANSINNFQFESVGLGQFTGVLTLRPQEMLYLGY